MNDVVLKFHGFRLPTDLRRNLFSIGDKGIDLDNLREVVQSLEKFFGCAQLSFSYEEDLRGGFE